MRYANTIDSHSQFANYDQSLFFNGGQSIGRGDHLPIPFGRLHTGPQYLQASVTWTTSTTVLTDRDTLRLFDDISMKKQDLKDFIPTGIEGEWLTTIAPFPRLCWNRPNFLGPFPHLRYNTPGLPLLNTRWVVWYGFSVEGSVGIDSNEQDFAPGESLITEVFDQSDSGIEGWQLGLIHFDVEQPTPDAPPQADYVMYSHYHLDPVITLWNPEIPSKWLIDHNVLNLPPHYITVRPWQP